ncbi:hypothetical protein QBC37DRAFT_104982 [Rhypophila decipiens]|uniref:DUF676 domain-containing protein n=1 Tax=Rhypophila decipiens TaxID=261697 RepID=A0AAN6Y0D7_9PEZI|nr:hypothetical protein QBC37DRAFT_104982 [Rhypophila decipiens]
MASTSTSPKHQKGLLELVKRENADLDIVAIHGLQGDAIQSWTHERTKFMWLTDYLPEQFPKARIFTYAYNSGVWFNGSTKTIEQESVNLLTYLDHKVEQDRPLIFICHSMGGILLKAAMVKANNERKKYGFLLEHPKVAVFMATPHGGSKIASCVDHLVKLPLPSSWFINKKHIKNLKSHSEELEEMSDNFDERKEEFRAILSFYETKPYPKVGSLVVQKHSANLHEGKLIGLDADHSTICKFESKMDTQLMMVVEELRRTVANVLPSLNMPTTDLGSTHTPPQYKQQGLVYGIFGQVELEPLSSSPLPSSPLPTYRSTNSLTPNRYRGGWTPIASPSSSNTNLSLSSFNPPSLGESYPSTVIDDNAGSGSSRPSRSTPNIRNT